MCKAFPSSWWNILVPGGGSFREKSEPSHFTLQTCINPKSYHQTQDKVIHCYLAEKRSRATHSESTLFARFAEDVALTSHKSCRMSNLKSTRGANSAKVSPSSTIQNEHRWPLVTAPFRIRCTGKPLEGFTYPLRSALFVAHHQRWPGKDVGQAPFWCTSTWDLFLANPYSSCTLPKGPIMWPIQLKWRPGRDWVGVAHPSVARIGVWCTEGFCLWWNILLCE